MTYCQGFVANVVCCVCFRQTVNFLMKTRQKISRALEHTKRWKRWESFVSRLVCVLVLDFDNNCEFCTPFPVMLSRGKRGKWKGSKSFVLRLVCMFVLNFGNNCTFFTPFSEMLSKGKDWNCAESQISRLIFMSKMDDIPWNAFASQMCHV